MPVVLESPASKVAKGIVKLAAGVQDGRKAPDPAADGLDRPSPRGTGLGRLWRPKRSHEPDRAGAVTA